MKKLKEISFATWRHWREISFVYFIQLIIGFIVGLTFCSAMCSSLDTSMVLDQLAKGFDRTVIMDVLNTNESVLDSTKTVAFTLLGVYLLISILLHAGWLANIKTNSYSIKSQLRHGIKFFFPFLGIAVLSLLLIIVFAGVVGVSFTKIVGDPLITFSSEKPYVIWILVLLGIFILWVILVWSWSVSSRFHYINSNSFFAALKSGFKTVRKKWLIFEGLSLLFIGIHILLMLLYNWIMEDHGTPSWLIVIIIILVQQFFAFTRVLLRGLAYSLVENINE